MPFQENECEVCGRPAQKLIKRIIEGAIMNVCISCQDLGEEPPENRRKRVQQAVKASNTGRFASIMGGGSANPAPRPAFTGPSKRSPKDPDAKFTNFRVIDEAPAELLKLRTQLSLSLDKFAESLKIKANYYSRIEKGATALPLDLARLIEKKYKIKLVEQEDFDEEDDVTPYIKERKKPDLGGGGMIYIKKRGEKPEYD
jgi:ribosome-binding protein aMBF1 (putative translation factor)